MDATNQIKMFFSMFTASVPTLLVCMVAGFVILSRWKEAPAASKWALMGFALVGVLGFVMPAVYAFIQARAMPETMTARATLYTMLSIVSSVLHAAAYSFLLVAIFAGRSTPTGAASSAAGPATKAGNAPD